MGNWSCACAVLVIMWAILLSYRMKNGFIIDGPRMKDPDFWSSSVFGRECIATVNCVFLSFFLSLSLCVCVCVCVCVCACICVSCIMSLFQGWTRSFRGLWKYFWGGFLLCAKEHAFSVGVACDVDKHALQIFHLHPTFSSFILVVRSTGVHQTKSKLTNKHAGFQFRFSCSQSLSQGEIGRTFRVECCWSLFPSGFAFAYLIPRNSCRANAIFILRAGRKKHPNFLRLAASFWDTAVSLSEERNRSQKQPLPNTLCTTGEWPVWTWRHFLF